MEILGTEGVADDQGGRKPGGVVNGSVKEVKKAETGPLYMSDSRPRVCQGPMSSPSRLTSMVEGYATFCDRWSFHESPGSRVLFKLCSFSTSKVRFRYEDTTLQYATLQQKRRWIYLLVMFVVIIHLTLIVRASNASIRGGECIDIIGKDCIKAVLGPNSKENRLVVLTFYLLKTREKYHYN